MQNAVIRKFRELMAAKKSRGQFWKSVPLGSLALFQVAIFSLFASLGFVALMMRTVRLPVLQVVLSVLFTGGFAALFAIAALLKKYVAMPVIFVVQMIGFSWLGRHFQNDFVLASKGSELHTQLQVLGAGAVVMLVSGYACFLLFSSQEGERFFRTHTEIVLARELHQALVPEIQQTIGGFEIYGASVPSGEVGGDLVDLVPHGTDWTAYVADVSGHGIAPGVLMAMFKASVRSRILAGCDPQSLPEGVHQTLYPLKTSNMFVTAGFLQERGGHLNLSLAGHPALVHLRKRDGQICEYASTDLPMGILPEQTFSSREIECRPGDILLLLTDGITEAANSREEELGMEAVKSALRRSADMPLAEIFRTIRSLALGFGKQADDQTMLLVRRLS
jgi:Stage II sporulation protein E (SpoIIE)